MTLVDDSGNRIDIAAERAQDERQEAQDIAASLNDRGRLALRWLHENTDPPPEGAEWWRTGERTAYAFQVGDVLRDGGLARENRNSNARPVSGAANTLVALKRRGLAANDGGGCFIQNRWWITPEGRKVATA